MVRKIGLFFLSLWLLFVLIIFITIKIPYCFSGEWQFIGWTNLLGQNIVPVICILSLIVGSFSYFDFNYRMKGSPNLSFKITNIEDIDYEHLTFLTTYIIPLVCFEFENPRYLIVFIIVLIVIGMIYIRTDLFYANPTLAILKFKIYKVNGLFRNEKIEGPFILITKDNLTETDRVKYIKLDRRIFYAFKIKIEE